MEPAFRQRVQPKQSAGHVGQQAAVLQQGLPSILRDGGGRRGIRLHGKREAKRRPEHEAGDNRNPGRGTEQQRQFPSAHRGRSRSGPGPGQGWALKQSHHQQHQQHRGDDQSGHLTQQQRAEGHPAGQQAREGEAAQQRPPQGDRQEQEKTQGNVRHDQPAVREQCRTEGGEEDGEESTCDAPQPARPPPGENHEGDADQRHHRPAGGQHGRGVIARLVEKPVADHDYG